MKTPAPNLTVPKPDASYKELLYKSIAKAQEEHAAKELAAGGRLRGGSVGCMMPTGETVGQCPRSVLARYLGYSFEAGPSSLLYFENGFANEDIWAKHMDNLYVPWIRDEKCELVYDIEHEGETVQVSGSPDQLIYPGQALATGAEHKMICSASTAEAAQLKGQPKDEHLIQAAHYCSALQVPYAVVYSNLNVHIANYYTKKRYPDYFPAKGVPKIQPAITEFPLDIEEGKVYYWSGDTRRETIVTVGGILDFYRMVIEATQRKDLKWFRRGNFDIHGEQYPFDLEAYCDTCRAAPSDDWDEWNEQLHDHIVTNGGISRGERYESKR
jgi:hypothetical protein